MSAAAKLCPREPTVVMTNEGVNVLRVTGGSIYDDVRAMWRAMYDAAPAPAAERQPIPGTQTVFPPAAPSAEPCAAGQYQRSEAAFATRKDAGTAPVVTDAGSTAFASEHHDAIAAPSTEPDLAVGLNLALGLNPAKSNEGRPVRVQETGAEDVAMRLPDKGCAAANGAATARSRPDNPAPSPAAAPINAASMPVATSGPSKEGTSGSDAAPSAEPSRSDTQQYFDDYASGDHAAPSAGAGDTDGLIERLLGWADFFAAERKPHGKELCAEAATALARLRTESEQLREEWTTAKMLEQVKDQIIARQGAELYKAEAERDALAAAMPSEGADAALAYAAMKTERDAAVARVDRAEKVIDVIESAIDEHINARPTVGIDTTGGWAEE